MKRIYYPQLSGESYLVCSVSWDGGESEFYDYFKKITAEGDCSSIAYSITALSSGTLNKGNAQKYHAFSQFKDPDLYVLKIKAHRFFLLYDRVFLGGAYRDAVIIVCCTRKQRDDYTKKDLRWMDAARMKYWNNRAQCWNEETKEEL